MQRLEVSGAVRHLYVVMRQRVNKISELRVHMLVMVYICMHQSFLVSRIALLETRLTYFVYPSPPVSGLVLHGGDCYKNQLCPYAGLCQVTF
jgi:hypothetical protein